MSTSPATMKSDSVAVEFLRTAEESLAWYAARVDQLKLEKVRYVEMLKHIYSRSMQPTASAELIEIGQLIKAVIAQKAADL